MALLGRDEVPVGEEAEVAMDIMLDDRLAEDLHAGAQFSLYEGGRRVVTGVVIALLDHIDTANSRPPSG
jgi:translation elongation factor EF-Tu-like GTPase